MSKNLFGFVLERESNNTESYPLTIGGVRKWVKSEFGFDISKSTVCAVRNKCGANELALDACKCVPRLKSEKEIAVLEAFKAMGIISEDVMRGE